MGEDDEGLPSKTTLWYRSAKKLLIHFSVLYRTGLVVKLDSKALMCHFIKLAEIKQDGVDLFPLIQSVPQFMDCCYKLSLT